MPRVSVVIPCYKQRRYFVKTLNSAFSQSFSDYEIIHRQKQLLLTADEDLQLSLPLSLFAAALRMQVVMKYYLRFIRLKHSFLEPARRRASLEDASRRPAEKPFQARRVADRTSATGGQARDGLSAGHGVLAIRPQSSVQKRSAPPCIRPELYKSKLDPDEPYLSLKTYRLSAES